MSADRFSRLGSLVAIAVLLAGCGGGAAAVAPGGPAATSPVGADRGTARFTIAVPKASASTASARRSPRYVSPATASMTVSIVTNPGGSSQVNETVGLTPTSNGCSSTLASTSCTLTISLPAGSYDAAISTYDGANGTGNELSQGQLVDFTIAEGQANAIALTLSGIPASLHVIGAAYPVQGSQSGGFTLYGAGAQNLIVEALDPDGNVIVGPGSPTFTLAQSAGSGFTIANPTATSPNTVKLTPPGTNGTSETFSLTAAYSDSTCSISGAVCSATFSVKNDVQTLFAVNPSAGDVTAYAPPYTGTPATITNSLSEPFSLAVDASSNLFVADESLNTVTEYAPPYTGAPITSISSSVNGPKQMRLDAVSDLFVIDSSAVTEYAPPYTGTPTSITNTISEPGAIALNTSGELFVGNLSSNKVTGYTSPYTGAPAVTISTGINYPGSLAFDAAGDLFVANQTGETVTEYAAPYTGSPKVTISSGISGPESLVFDPLGNLFVANHAGNTVTEYASPYTGAPVVTLSGLSQPNALVLDGAGDLFVANQANSTISIYAPPYTGTPTTISTGLSHPDAIQLTP
ncbi:MAG TPA: hypothetical protein VMD91_07845 [Candidatus Sulfotelmatobacter sp.]|nr:hypothetical protein [Candidatus Sulfotelmatobacter sp.]